MHNIRRPATWVCHWAELAFSQHVNGFVTDFSPTLFLLAIHLPVFYFAVLVLLTCPSLPLAARSALRRFHVKILLLTFCVFSSFFFVVGYFLFSLCCFTFVAAEEALGNCLQPLCACQYAAVAHVFTFLWFVYVRLSFLFRFLTLSATVGVRRTV